MNLQLHHVVTGTSTGATGMAIIRASCGRGARSGGAGRPPRPALLPMLSVETIGQALVGNDREEHMLCPEWRKALGVV